MTIFKLFHFDFGVQQQIKNDIWDLKREKQQKLLKRP